MKIKRKAIFTLIVATVLFLTSGNAFSTPDNAIDVVLVMDSSGSMKKTDPRTLRIPAAQLFISLLDDNDRAAVVSFSDRGYPLSPLTPVDTGENRDRLLKATEQISSSGLYTNLYDGLRKGHEMLSADEKSGRTRFIILMSDGVMDVGNPETDKILLDKIKNELGMSLEADDVKVYAIAFTEQADMQLLEKISKGTGGFYNLALTDRDFHLIFTSIFESLKRPDMLPVTENGFLIDGSIEEVTIVATKGSPDTQIHLDAPDRQRYSNKDKSTGIGWFASNNFDMITVQKPAEGEWKILFSTGDNNRAYIITNLKLQTNFDQLYSTFGDPLDIKIWLEKDGRTITERDVLDKFEIYLEMISPDGKTSKLSPFNKGEGLFVRRIAPFTPGNYTLRIVARGNTLEREKSFVFNIADARESKADILAKREKEKLTAHKVKERPDNNTSHTSWTKIIIQFVLLNLVLGILVLGYLKRKGLSKIKGRINLSHIPVIKGIIKILKGIEGEEAEKRQDNEAEVLQAHAQELRVKAEVKEKEERDEPGIEEIKQENKGNDTEDDTASQGNGQEGEKKAQHQKGHDEKERSPEARGGGQEVQSDNIAPQLNQEDLDQLIQTEAGTGKDSEEAQGKSDAEAQAEQKTALDIEIEKLEKKFIEENPGPDVDAAQESKDEGKSESLQSAEEPFTKETTPQDTQQEMIDDLWEEAMQAQKGAEAGSIDSEEIDDNIGDAAPTSTDGDPATKEGTQSD